MRLAEHVVDGTTKWEILPCIRLVLVIVIVIVALVNTRDLGCRERNRDVCFSHKRRRLRLKAEVSGIACDRNTKIYRRKS